MKNKKMTDKITLELTLDELKTLDKHIEYNDETKSVFDKIKYSYPQPKMIFQQEGDYAVVSYNDMTYYRLMNETSYSWWIVDESSKSIANPYLLVMIQDPETEKLLEGLYYNHIEVKKETAQEPQDNEWKNVALEFGKKLPAILPYSYAELSPNSWYRWVVFTYDKYMEERDKECGYTPNQKAQEPEEQVSFVPKEIKELVEEGVKWCEEHKNENPLDWLTPKTPEETEQSLKEAFREAVKQGVVSSTKSPTLYDVCMEWWEDAYTKNCIDDLVSRIEAWLPKEHDTNSYKWNQCIRTIKEKLR